MNWGIIRFTKKDRIQPLYYVSVLVFLIYLVTILVFEQKIEAQKRYIQLLNEAGCTEIAKECLVCKNGIAKKKKGSML